MEIVENIVVEEIFVSFDVNLVFFYLYDYYGDEI